MLAHAVVVGCHEERVDDDAQRDEHVGERVEDEQLDVARELVPARRAVPAYHHRDDGQPYEVTPRLLLFGVLKPCNSGATCAPGGGRVHRARWQHQVDSSRQRPFDSFILPPAHNFQTSSSVLKHRIINNSSVLAHTNEPFDICKTPGREVLEAAVHQTLRTPRVIR